MKICADGYIDLRDRRRVRTPGKFDRPVEPMPEAEAVSFLLSHSFPGHRRIVRPLEASHRKKLRLARLADSVNDRMHLVDWVWRSITEPVPPPTDPGQPQLVQVVRYGQSWAYPLYLVGSVTQVLPRGGLTVSGTKVPRPIKRGLNGSALDLRSA